MPLSAEEAKRSLDLFWEVKEAALEEGRDTSAVNRAISMLHSYVTEIQPSTQLSVWDHYRWGAADGLRTTRSSAFGPLHVVELICSVTEKLGIYLDTVSAFSKDVHSSHGFPPVVISLLKPLSTAERSGELAIGDQVLEINGHSLAQVSLQKARWLLESAYRSGKVILVVVSSGLVRGLKKSHTVLSSPFGALENLSTLASTAPSAKLPLHADNRSTHSSVSSLQDRPTYTPSLGSRGSDHNLLATTVELAAHLGMKKPLFKKRKVVKLHVMKGPEELGLSLFGGKHSKAGDIGIFIREIKEGSWVHRDGRLKVGDELLVVNRKSLIGLTLKDALEVINMATNPLQLVIATEKSEESARSSYNRDSGASFSFLERERSEPQSQLGSTFAAASIQPAADTQQGSPALSWGGLSFPGTPELGTYPKVSLALERTASLGQDSILSSNLPRVISDSSMVSNFSENRPSPALTPVKAPKRGARRRSEPATLKRSKLAMFFKREKRPKKSVPAVTSSADKAQEKQKLANRLSDDVSIGKELYPVSPVEVDPPAPEDPQEERDLVGDLELHQPARLKGAPKQRPSVTSTTSYTSIQSMPPGDLTIVTNWARLSSTSSLPEIGSATPRLGIVKTVLLYKPPKSQHKPLGFTLHGGNGSHFGDVGIHIKSIAPDSLADADSRLQEGDQVLEVNSQPVEGMTHKRVAQLIKREYAKFGMISLKVQTSEGPLSQRQPLRSPSVKGTPFQVVLKKEPGASLGIEFTGLTFDDNHFGIYIQNIAEGSCASKNKKLQRGDQILSVNGSSLVEIQMDQVHSLFGNLPHGDVVLKLTRPTNVAAVHLILDDIASAKRKSREGNFTVEVFGQAGAGTVLRAGMSPMPEPRAENAPAVDPEILNLFENEGESPVFQEREVKPRDMRPTSYVIDTSRHSRVDDSDLSSSEEETEPVRDHSPPDRDLPTAVSLTHLPGERPRKEVPVEGDTAEDLFAPPVTRMSSASFSTSDVISKRGLRNNLLDMQTLFASAGTSGDYTGKELRGLSRNFSALSGTSTLSFITETVSIHRGPDGFGMTILGGQDTPLRGALVTAVEKDGPAFLEGGIERGDEVLEVNGQSILGLNHSEVISVLRSISGVAHLVIARSAPEHMQSLVTSQNSLAKSDKTDTSLPPPIRSSPPPPTDTSIKPVPSFGKEDKYSRGAIADHFDDDASSSTGRDDVGMKSKSYSSEAVLESTDDELADQPTIIRETVASMSSGTVATLDGRRLRPPLVGEGNEPEQSVGRGGWEEGPEALEATPVILAASASSSSGTSLNEVGRGELQPTPLSLQLRKTPPPGHQPSRPVSKASSGMSIVVSYAVDWHEEQEESKPPSLLDKSIDEVPIATREDEPGQLATGSAEREMKMESEVQGELQNSVKSGKESGEGEGEEVDEKGFPIRFERLMINLQKKPRTGVGITVVSSRGPTAGYHQIRRILPRSLADRDGQLRPGDRLLSVNGKSLYGLTHAAVLDELKTNAKECALEILRDPLFDADATSSVYSLGSGSYGGSLSVLSVTSDDGAETSSTRRFSAHTPPTAVDQRRLRPLRNHDPEVRRSALPSLLSDRAGNLTTIQQNRPASMPEPLEEYAFLRKPSDTVSPLAMESRTSSPPIEAAVQESMPFVVLDQYVELPPSDLPPDLPVEKVPNEEESHAGEDCKEPPSLLVLDQTDHPSSLPSVVGPHQAPAAVSDQWPDPSVADGGTAQEAEMEELPRKRIDKGPFLVEVTKGFFSLGLTAGEDSTGAVVVKALQSRSPFSKHLKVGDWLLSVNNHTPKSATHANEVIKSLPRGPVHVVAMAPPCNVTGLSEGVCPAPPTEPAPPPPPGHESLPEVPPAPPPQESEAPAPHPTGEQPWTGDEPVSAEEDKVIEVEINRQGRPLGIVIQGGSDMPQQYVYIHSIQPGSPADECHTLRHDDQLIMCGDKCLVGLTWKEAQGVMNAAPERLTVIAQRKQQSKSTLVTSHSSNAAMKKSTTDSSFDSFCSFTTDAVEQPQTLTRNSSQELLPPIPGSPPPDADVPLVLSTPNIKYSSCTSSVADLEDFDKHSLTVEEEAIRSAREGEEVFALDLCRSQGDSLGFVIAGGDNITPDIYVKKIVPESVAGRDGRLKKGDRVMFVNECSLAGMTKAQATDLLRSTGQSVQLIIARRPLLTGSATSTPLDSLPASQAGSRDTSPPPTPKLRQSPSAGTLRRRHKRSDSVSSLQSGRHKLSDSVGSLHSITEDLLDTSSASLPRDIGSRLGVKLVELVKGPTGLGMKIVGGKDQPKPFIVRDVFPGGSAAKSGQVCKNDQILEVNGQSFDSLTHREAIEYLKTLPPGKVQMLLRSAEFVKVS